MNVNDTNNWTPNYLGFKDVRRKKVQEGNGLEMAPSERNSHSKNRGVGNKLN